MAKEYQVPELKFKNCNIPDILSPSELVIDTNALNDCDMVMDFLLETPAE